MNILLLALLLAQGLAGSQSDKGILTGQLRSMRGEPVGGVRVAAMLATEPKQVSGGSELTSLTQTDASGNYRLENLPPGRYYIIAGLIDFPSYFPGVLNIAEATVVTVAAGATVPGMDFTLARGVNVRVQGRVTGLSAGFRPQLSRIYLVPMTIGVRPERRESVAVNGNGTFEISNVAPGTYHVMLSAPDASMRQPVTVVISDSDITNIVLAVFNPETTTRREGLEMAWSLEGRWPSIALDQKSGVFYAAGSRGFDEIDHTGKIRNVNSLAANISRVARFSQDESPFFLTGAFSRQVHAFDGKGTLLWSYPADSTGILDVWAADLDGDRLDEVIIGFNGNTGLHVVNSKGELVWKTESIGNVGHVAAGNVRGENLPQVVATSALGVVHVFSADGNKRNNLRPGFYANMVRVSSSTIIALGSSLTMTPGTSLVVAAGLDADGGKKWTLELPTGSQTSVHTAEVSPGGKPWLAVGLRDGQVYVIDTDRGVIIARIDGQSLSPSVGWMINRETGSPLLVVSTRTRVNAYRINN